VKPSTEKALARVLDRLDRDSRRTRRGFSRAPIYLTLGLVVGYQLLVRFVPMVWSSTLPHGLAQAGHLAGWPGLLWRLAMICHGRFTQVVVVLGAIAFTGFLLARGPWPMRLLVWLAAFGIVLIDALIVFLALSASLGAVLDDSGLS
jgi:type IV secretory pathway VirB2 component (pilin)